MLTLEDIVDLALGKYHAVAVCEISHTFANFLYAQTPRVYLSRESLAHIRKEHPNDIISDFLILPDAIAKGMILRDMSRPNHLVVCYEKAEGVRYVAVLKATLRGDAIYVQTFHRGRRRQTRSLMRRARLIRAHR